MLGRLRSRGVGCKALDGLEDQEVECALLKSDIVSFASTDERHLMDMTKSLDSG